MAPLTSLKPDTEHLKEKKETPEDVSEIMFNCVLIGWSFLFTLWNQSLSDYLKWCNDICVWRFKGFSFEKIKKCKSNEGETCSGAFSMDCMMTGWGKKTGNDRSIVKEQTGVNDLWSGNSLMQKRKWRGKGEPTCGCAQYIKNLILN